MCVVVVVVGMFYVGGVVLEVVWVLFLVGDVLLVDVCMVEEWKFVGYVFELLYVLWVIGMSLMCNLCFVCELEVKIGKDVVVLLLCCSGNCLV